MNSLQMRSDEFAELLRETYEMSHAGMTTISINYNRINTTAALFAEAYSAASQTPFSMEEPGPQPGSSLLKPELPLQHPISGKSELPDTQNRIEGSAESPPDMQENSRPNTPSNTNPTIHRMRSRPLPIMQNCHLMMIRRS